ncbi:pilus (MSHA type) biogenesis protein MshL [Idiomarina sp.]|uniref:pilus (MSHA type) biogenesis protein MshL n=1 Tax=Idiomarina sp. TaxID=1874361 RepID=UPI001D5AEB25|nr:pilus (MSHA type) biogenesis protein MshL [Idiomarina sp.]MCJ8316738.1 pilus (MSHA type) biogenesis protein MshL [Idiomarina sp.]NQZ16378.1 pilus (MSHA type) biogenesis protein MshL [Idiomarina sp.]
MRILLLVLSVAFTGCAYQPGYTPNKEKEAMTPDSQADAGAPARQEGMPAAVSEYLRQDVSAQEQQGIELLEEDRFVLQAEDIDAKQFFYGLAADTPYNMLVHPDVSGSISLSLKDVTLNETLSAVQDIYGFEIRRQGRTIQVYPAGVRTKTFSLDYLSLKRFGMSQTEISGGGVSEERDNNRFGGNNNNSSAYNSTGTPFTGNDSGQFNRTNQQLQGNGSSINTQSETDLWGDLKEVIEGIIGGGNVVLSPQAGIVSVTASPDKLRAVGDFIDTLESRLQRQVILEARIIEVTLNDGYQQGINWSDLASGNAGFDVEFNGVTPSNATSAAIGGLFGLSYNDEANGFNGMIEMLQTQGTVQVLSNPRVSASNNQKAVIKIGEDEYYVTNVDSTTNLAGGSGAAVSNSNVDLTPFFSGISLDVTPQISDDGEVILHVHPSVVETEEQQKVITLTDGELVLPLARSNIRESDTIVKARNGEIVVLGGLMQTVNSEEVGKVPLLGDIPLLGELFTNRRNRQEKKELVILLKPTVVGVDTWRDELKRSRELLNEWFPDIEQ